VGAGMALEDDLVGDGLGWGEDRGRARDGKLRVARRFGRRGEVPEAVGGSGRGLGRGGLSERDDGSASFRRGCTVVLALATRLMVWSDARGRRPTDPDRNLLLTLWPVYRRPFELNLLPGCVA